MYKHIFYKAAIALFIVGLSGFSSCGILDGPNFSNTPSISFDRFDIKRNHTDKKLGNRVDSITIIINFKDGDGDLGLTSTDRTDNPEFQQFLADGTPNRYWYNYFVRVFRKTKGEFAEFFPNPSFSGAFPPLKPDGKPGPIEGDLEYGLSFPLFSSPANDTLQFEIQIADKKKNESNIIRTPEIIINPK